MGIKLKVMKYFRDKKSLLSRTASIAICALAVLAVFTAHTAVAATWSVPGIWVGKPDDEMGSAMAAKFRVQVNDIMMGIPIYDLHLKFNRKTIAPLVVNSSNITKGMPDNIVWTAYYNGYAEERVTYLSANQDDMLVRFTAFDPQKSSLYAIEGVVNYTSSTERHPDIIVVVFNSIQMAKVYMGKSFSALVGMESKDIDGMHIIEEHSYLYQMADTQIAKKLEETEKEQKEKNKGSTEGVKPESVAAEK